MPQFYYRHGVSLSSSVLGKIETHTRLSGMFCSFGRASTSILSLGTPELLLSFTNPHVLSDCSFHPCIRSVRVLSLCSETGIHIILVCNDGHTIKYFHSYLLTESLYLQSIVIPQMRLPQRASPQLRLRLVQVLLTQITFQSPLVLKRVLIFKHIMV